MQNQTLIFNQNKAGLGGVSRFLTVAPDLSPVSALTDGELAETIDFLNQRPVHTVVMSSFIADNGLQHERNRGTFYGYRNAGGQLEGVALIGHSTLVEARSDEALKALAFAARKPPVPIHLVMSSGDSAERFWSYLSGGATTPRLTYVERLFELSFPLAVPDCPFDLRAAANEDLLQVAQAQADIAFMESGVNPLDRDRNGFLSRVQRRIDQERVFVVTDDSGRLIFKADIIAETAMTAYLEGAYVDPEYRGHGVGSRCLARLSQRLLERVDNVCLLSNIDFDAAHKSYLRAGFKPTDECTTIFS